jgi:hypothetical protein|tara:strand:+ start:1714 stop:1935 length:222 start_codon:yes stop_codon:yes gene_type:complete
MTESAQEKLTRRRAMYEDRANGMLNSLVELNNQWRRDINLDPDGEEYRHLHFAINKVRHAVAMCAGRGVSPTD